MLDFLYLVSFKVFVFIVKYMPNFITNILLDFLAFLAYKLDKKHKKIARVNLDLAFGDKLNQDEKRAIIKKCYKNLL